MAFQINDDERDALNGLRYLTRCLYYAGIRPYMDFSTCVVGVKRKISWQSLSEELYIEPVAGILTTETGSPGKQQIRRAAKELERVGLIEIKSSGTRLIFKCLLATRDKSVQNQADTRPTPFLDIGKPRRNTVKQGVSEVEKSQAVPPHFAQADTPPVSGIISNKLDINTLGHFDKFWQTYPKKVKKSMALKVWVKAKLDNQIDLILDDLKVRLQNDESWQDTSSRFIPHPTTYLSQRRWEDEEKVATGGKHATSSKHSNSAHENAWDYLAKQARDESAR